MRLDASAVRACGRARACPSSHIQCSGMNLVACDKSDTHARGWWATRAQPCKRQPAVATWAQTCATHRATMQDAAHGRGVPRAAGKNATDAMPDPTRKGGATRPSATWSCSSSAMASTIALPAPARGCRAWRRGVGQCEYSEYPSAHDYGCRAWRAIVGPCEYSECPSATAYYFCGAQHRAPEERTRAAGPVAARRRGADAPVLLLAASGPCNAKEPRRWMV